MPGTLFKAAWGTRSDSEFAQLIEGYLGGTLMHLARCGSMKEKSQGQSKPPSPTSVNTRLPLVEALAAIQTNPEDTRPSPDFLPTTSVLFLPLSNSEPHTSTSTKGQTMLRPFLGRCRAPKIWREEEERGGLGGQGGTRKNKR